MKSTTTARIARWGGVLLVILLVNKAVGADDPPITREQILQLQQQNAQLQQQLQKQQELIDSLSRKVSEIQTANSQRDHDVGDLKQQVQEEKTDGDKSFSSSLASHLGKVAISGEGSADFFESGANGQTPNAEFRIGEARLFVDAPVWNDVYFYTELDIAEPEQTDLNLRAGELYLDFEDISQLWGRDRMLNLRVGRFYIPFGEEYLNRFAIDNPLISRSLTDIWGRDEGAELYGTLGRMQYVVAVQNGGPSTSRDFTPDKSVTGRISYDPKPWLHLSVSGMRTGNLDVNLDGTSEMWFANSWIRPLGAPATTTSFHANLVEGDVQVSRSGIRLKAAGGYLNYGDNDSAANNDRDVYYYYVEGMQDFTSKFYGAVRMSEVFANNGFPIVGNGNMATFGFGPLTTDYWRLSLGLGYRFSPNLVIKGEYSFNQGREVGGAPRVDQDLFALEAAFKF